MVGVNNVSQSLPILWILARSELSSVQVVACDAQQVSVHFHLNQAMHTYTFVYASMFYTSRRLLWLFLLNFSSTVLERWSVIGDFNSFLGAHEKT